MNSKWTTEKLRLLGNLINKKKVDFHEAAEKTGFSWQACKRKHERTDWDNFDNNMSNPKPWRIEDLITLYTLKEEARVTYKEIGQKLHRSPGACESKFQATDWNQILSHRNAVSEPQKASEAEQEKINQENARQMAIYMVELSRHSLQRLDEITQTYFLEKANISKDELPVPFSRIKELASQQMNSMGLGYDEHRDLEEGTYIIFGDSHGKRTKTRMFNLDRKSVV